MVFSLPAKRLFDVLPGPAALIVKRTSGDQTKGSIGEHRQLSCLVGIFILSVYFILPFSTSSRHLLFAFPSFMLPPGRDKLTSVLVASSFEDLLRFCPVVTLTGPSQSSEPTPHAFLLCLSYPPLNSPLSPLPVLFLILLFSICYLLFTAFLLLHLHTPYIILHRHPASISDFLSDSYRHLCVLFSHITPQNLANPVCPHQPKSL